MSRTVPVNAYYFNMIINSSPFHPQKYPVQTVNNGYLTYEVFQDLKRKLNRKIVSAVQRLVNLVTEKGAMRTLSITEAVAGNGSCHRRTKVWRIKGKRLYYLEKLGGGPLQSLVWVKARVALSLEGGTHRARGLRRVPTSWREYLPGGHGDMIRVGLQV